MHLAAYFNATQAAVADTDMPGVSDVFAVLQNSHFLFQQDRYVYWAAHLSGSALRSKFNAADLRSVSNPYIIPVGAALLPGSDPNFADYRDLPLKLNKLEEIAMLVTDSASSHHAYVLFQSDPNPSLTPVPAGQIFTMRFTSTTAAVAAAWTQLSVTWQDTLPGGNYICTGLQCEGANLIGARMIFPNQTERPGTIGQNAVTNKTMWRGKKGALGIWGRFTSTYLPFIEVLDDSTDSSFEGEIDFMRAA